MDFVKSCKPIELNTLSIHGAHNLILPNEQRPGALYLLLTARTGTAYIIRYCVPNGIGDGIKAGQTLPACLACELHSGRHTVKRCFFGDFSDAVPDDFRFAAE